MEPDQAQQHVGPDLGLNCLQRFTASQIFLISYCLFAQEVSGKNVYTMQEVGKVKIELQQVLTKLDGEKTTQKDLREKLSETDTKLSGITHG